MFEIGRRPRNPDLFVAKPNQNILLHRAKSIAEATMGAFVDVNSVRSLRTEEMTDMRKDSPQAWHFISLFLQKAIVAHRDAEAFEYPTTQEKAIKELDTEILLDARIHGIANPDQFVTLAPLEQAAYLLIAEYNIDPHPQPETINRVQDRLGTLITEYETRKAQLKPTSLIQRVKASQEKLVYKARKTDPVKKAILTVTALAIAGGAFGATRPNSHQENPTSTNPSKSVARMVPAEHLSPSTYILPFPKASTTPTAEDIQKIPTLVAAVKNFLILPINPNGHSFAEIIQNAGYNISEPQQTSQRRIIGPQGAMLRRFPIRDGGLYKELGPLGTNVLLYAGTPVDLAATISVDNGQTTDVFGVPDPNSKINKDLGLEGNTKFIYIETVGINGTIAERSLLPTEKNP